jgi:general secretion pathway protein D
MRFSLTIFLAAAAWAQNNQPQVPFVFPITRMPPPRGAGGAGRGQRAQQQPVEPATQPAAQPAATAQSGTATTATRAVSGPMADSGTGFVMNLQNAGLTEVVDILARQLKITYILDPRVKGTVTISTWGEIKQIDARALLETVLRINGAAIVQVGDIYRIVPVADAARLPVPPETEPKSFSNDERMMLNLVFLKYATVAELSKLLEPFLGEGARMISYDPANLLLILDNSRNMKRMMDLIATFDNDTLAGQRVRLLEVKNSRPTQLAKELDAVMKAVSLGGEKTSTVKFLPIDRINTIVAIAPNPGVFGQVETWLKKLDVPAKASAGTTENHVYRVKYGQADVLASAIMQLYFGSSGGGSNMYGGGYSGYNALGTVGSQMSTNSAFNTMSGGLSGARGFGTNGASSGYGGGMGGGMYGSGMGGGMYGGGMGGGMYGGGMGGGYEMGGASMYGGTAAPGSPLPTGTSGAGLAAGNTSDLTGMYMGAGGGRGGMQLNLPRVIPNLYNNSLLIHASEQDYAQILQMLDQIDISPRQVLVEAKIYEVDLSGDFSSGVQAWFNHRNVTKNGTTTATQKGAPTNVQSALNSAGGELNLTSAWLVGKSQELAVALAATESTGRSKVISAPSLIATDSIPASINVGESIPTLAAQVASNVSTSGTTDFAQQVVNQSTGVQLNVLAHTTPSGIITLVIDQQVSAPIAAPANISAPSSPSFSQRSVQTQVTVQDGDTIAIAGIITENHTSSTTGIPLLDRIPILGAAFGAKTIHNDRTEMVIFITPHMIYDTNQLVDASDQLKSNFKTLERIIKE